MQKKTEIVEEALLAELTSIKRLLVFALLRSEASQKDIAGALGIDQSQVSRMLANGKSGKQRR